MKWFLSFLVITSAQAQLFSNPFSSKAGFLDKSLEALEKLTLDGNGNFEERYSTLMEDAEKLLDLRRGQCQEFSSQQGAQQCVREVANGQKRLVETSYAAKKRLLTSLHERQLRQLDEARDAALKDMQKEF
jgi:hypothetical protein